MAAQRCLAQHSQHFLLLGVCFSMTPSVVETLLGKGGEQLLPPSSRERNPGTENIQCPVQWHWIQSHMSVSPDLLLMNQGGSVTSYTQVQLRNICRVTLFTHSVKKGEKRGMKRQGSKVTRGERERPSAGHVRQEHSA